MSQTLTVGALTLDPDQVSFVINSYGLVGQTGRVNKIRYIWSIDGRTNTTAPPGSSNADASAALAPKVIAVQNAFKSGCNLVFSLGATMRLISNQCLDGTIVKQFSWLKGTDGVRGTGAEGVWRRTFHAVVYGDILQATDTDIISWQQNLSYIGTGYDKTVPVGSLHGAIQAQRLQDYTPFWILQTGSAVGMTDYPIAASPIFQGVPGYYYMPDGVSTTPGTPQHWGINKNTGFPVRWSYRCWSSLPPIGNPRPGGF